MSDDPTARFERTLHEAHAAGAMSVQLVGGAPSWARTLKDGLLVLREPPLDDAGLQAVARALFGPARLERLPRDGVLTTSFRVAGQQRLARATLTSNLGQPSLGVRFHDAKAVVSLEALGGPPALQQLIDADHGLIVVAGPTGSGKTTTLYALLDWLNERRAVHIVTIEDPVGCELTSKRALVQQREIGTDVPDASRGIAAALAQDVDVLAICTPTDVESLGAALNAAETGHLVLLQVHAEDARDALARVIEAAPTTLQPLVRRNLADVVRGVVSQVLVPRVPHGRVQVHEVLVVDDALRVALREGRPLAGLAGGPGSVTRAQEVARHEAAGRITAETARRLRG